MEKLTYHYWVSGRVQGVYYRASTVTQANTLGVTGWVRNLPDGRVEVFACGNTSQLQALEAWLSQGPVAAKVEKVEKKEEPWQEMAGFVVR